MNIVEAKSLHRSVIYYDCQTTIDLVMSKEHYDTIKYGNGKYLSAKFTEVLVKHCSRSFNKVVGVVAKNCSSIYSIGFFVGYTSQVPHRRDKALLSL